MHCKCWVVLILLWVEHFEWRLVVRMFETFMLLFSWCTFCKSCCSFCSSMRRLSASSLFSSISLFISSNWKREDVNLCRIKGGGGDYCKRWQTKLFKPFQFPLFFCWWWWFHKHCWPPHTLCNLCCSPERDSRQCHNSLSCTHNSGRVWH